MFNVIALVPILRNFADVAEDDPTDMQTWYR
jgi:hypothetical protein